MQDKDAEFEDRLVSHFRSVAADHEAIAARVLHRLSVERLPSQKSGLLRWPSFLLNIDLTPAWPRVATLAVCGALGFAVGLGGLDARFDDASALTVASADVTSLVSDADALTSLQP